MHLRKRKSTVSYLVMMVLCLASSNNLALVKLQPIINSIEHKQIECLAKNIYHEARGESTTGKIAVAFVTLNRVKSTKYPKTICGVVAQKDKVGKCQFSWTCSKPKRIDQVKKDKSFAEALNLASYVYLNRDKLHDPTRGSLHYHAKSANPKWKWKKILQIGNHIFYN